MPVIETTRLRLRPYEMSDLADMSAMLGDREVTALTFLGCRNAEQSKELLEDYVAFLAEHGWGMASIRDKATDEYLGEVGFVATSLGGAGLRYALIKRGWGRGIAYEAATAMVADAFGRVGAERVVAGVKDGNAASRRILEKLGFVWESEVTHLGPPFALMALTAESWRRRS